MLQSLAYAKSQLVPQAIAIGQYPSLCQFMEPEGLGSSRAPTGNYVNVPGLVDLFTGNSAITCKDAPLSDSAINATEAKSLQDIESEGYRHISLSGYYPQVIQNWQVENANMNWRAVVDGTPYEVFGAEADSLRSQTRLKLRLVLV